MDFISKITPSIEYNNATYSFIWANDRLHILESLKENQKLDEGVTVDPKAKLLCEQEFKIYETLSKGTSLEGLSICNECYAVGYHIMNKLTPLYR